MMYLLQVLLATVFLAAQIGAFTSCNNASGIYNCSDGAVTTTTTTVTPIVTILVGPNSTYAMGTYNSTPGPVTVTTTVFVTTPCLPTLAARSLSPEAMDNIQIGTPMHSQAQGPLAFNDHATLDPSTPITAMPILKPRNPPMAPNDISVIAVPSTTSSDACQSVFGFNTTGSCNSSAQPSTSTTTTSSSSSLSPMTANTLNTTTTTTTIGTFNTTTSDLPTLPPSSPPPTTSPTDSAESTSTSTTVVVVSLTTATASGAPPTTTPTTIATPKPTTSTSSAHPAIFSWLNILWLAVFAKEACAAVFAMLD